MLSASLVCVFVSVLIVVVGGQATDGGKARAINRGPEECPNLCKEKAKVVDFMDCDDIENLAEFKDGKVRCVLYVSLYSYIYIDTTL